MRAVLDTNVIVSGLYSPGGPPGQVISAWRGGLFEWIASRPLIRELAAVLRRRQSLQRLGWSEEDVREFVKDVQARTDLVEPETEITAVAQDPSDNRVLEAAVAGRAAFVVTGDRHLLALKRFEGIEIISPVRFLAALRMKARGE